MKIGIDARFFGEAGPGRYTKSIVEHLEKIDNENEYIIFLNENGMKQYHPENPKFTKVEANYPWYSFQEQIGLLFKILSQNLDLYYVPHFNIPILYPKKIVTAIPDMTMHTYSTEKGTTLPLWYFRIKILVYKLVFWWAVFRSKKESDLLINLLMTDDYVSPNKERKTYGGWLTSKQYDQCVGFIRRLVMDKNIPKVSCDLLQKYKNVKVITFSEWDFETEKVLCTMNFSNKKQVVRDIIEKVIIKERRTVEVWCHISLPQLVTASTVNVGYEPIGRNSRPPKRWQIHSI